MMPLAVTNKHFFVEQQNSNLSSNLGQKSNNALVQIEKGISAAVLDGTSRICVSINNEHMFTTNPKQNVLIREYISTQYKTAGWMVKWLQDNDAHVEWEIQLQ